MQVLASTWSTRRSDHGGHGVVTEHPQKGRSGRQRCESAALECRRTSCLHPDSEHYVLHRRQQMEADRRAAA